MYDIEMKMLTKNKKVIPLIYGMGELWTTNIKLPDIIASNKGDGTVEIMAMEVSGICEEKEVLKLMLGKDEISAHIKQVIPEINIMITSGKQTGHAITYGKVRTLDEKLTDKTELNIYECTVIPLSKILFLNYTGRKIIDSIKFSLLVKGESGEQVFSYKIKLEQYKNKGNYIFPVKDKVCIVNLSMSINNHRQCLSQEFAFDVIGQGDMESIFLQPLPDQLFNYYIYRKDIMAIGDGIVVETGEKFPEASMSDPNKSNDEYRKKLFKELIPEIGFVNTLCGNYIVIDHENGEFSLYAHLSEDTICIKKGQRVKQGTVIGKVGNTGNSDVPHLHFQLMDSPNMLEANGLPVTFQNIKLDSISGNLTDANSFVFSDYIYADVK